MLFAKHLREGIRRGRIRCSIRIWTRPHVKVGGRYQMDDGHIVVDSITPITVADITYDLARESGFESVEDLLQIAKHGRGDNRDRKYTPSSVRRCKDALRMRRDDRRVVSMRSTAHQL